jgi:hypothetical protein
MGGLPPFDPGMVDTFKNSFSPPYIAGLVLYLLKDPSVATPTDPVDPVSNSCRIDPSCSAYLVSGGILSLIPWPIGLDNADAAAYQVRDAPVYQIEYGSMSGPIFPYSDHECRFYGGESINTLILQLCITRTSIRASPILAGRFPYQDRGYTFTYISS